MLVLYNPSSSATKKPVVPMSLLAVAAALQGERRCLIVDGNLAPNPWQALDRAVRETSARVVAMTVMPGPQLAEAVPLCRRLEVEHPQVTVVWGGYFPTQHYEACLRSSSVDYVLRGHSELAFRSFLDALDSGDMERLRATPGLAFRSAAGIETNPLPALPSPDELPDFPYEQVEMERYVRPTFMGRRTLPHHSSYGCPFTCNFCAVVTLVGGRWRAQTAERTAAVTRRLATEWRADAVEFYDNNFFVDERRVAEFSERITDLGLGWWGEARIDTLLGFDDSTWQRMRSSGLRMAFLGAESGSDLTLARMNKGGTATTDKTLAIAEKMRAYEIVPEFSFVVGNPPEPREDTEHTIAFVRRLKRVNPQAEIILYLYTPVPLAGELYEEAREQGFRFPETLEEWVSPEWGEFAERRSLSMPWLAGSLRRDVWNFESVLNAYYPTVTDYRLGSSKRRLLRAVSAWRYHSRFYRFPLELRLLHRLMSYQRPETSGF